MITELTELVEKFKAAYPAADGWQIYVNWPREFRRVLTGMLPEFLEKADHGWEATAPLCRGGVISFDTYDEHGVLIPLDKMQGKLREHGWSGDLTLKIDGEPLALRNYVFPGSERTSTLAVTLMACKDKAVIKRCFNAVARWDAARQNTKSKIAVCGANGINMEPRPALTWDKAVLPAGMADDIRNNVEGFFKSGDLYREIGVPHKRGFLFAGPPGNGKTLTAKILASDQRYSFCWLKLTTRTEDDTVQMAFAQAYKHPPGILLIEDLDRLAKDNNMTMSNILNQMDGLASREGILVIATTNAPEKLDPALVHRPSRFDRVWRMPLPGPEQRLGLLKLRGERFFSEEALRRVAEATGGFSMAYTQEVVTNALILSANEGARPVDGHLDRSLHQIKTQFKNTFAREGLGREEGQPGLGFAVAAGKE